MSSQAVPESKKMEITVGTGGGHHVTLNIPSENGRKATVKNLFQHRYNYLHGRKSQDETPAADAETETDPEVAEADTKPEVEDSTDLSESDEPVVEQDPVEQIDSPEEAVDAEEQIDGEEVPADEEMGGEEDASPIQEEGGDIIQEEPTGEEGGMGGNTVDLFEGYSEADGITFPDWGSIPGCGPLVDLDKLYKLMEILDDVLLDVPIGEPKMISMYKDELHQGWCFMQQLEVFEQIAIKELSEAPVDVTKARKAVKLNHVKLLPHRKLPIMASKPKMVAKRIVKKHSIVAKKPVVVRSMKKVTVNKKQSAPVHFRNIFRPFI